MLRRTFLWLSEHAGVFEFIRQNRLARQVASRFVAGETLQSAIEASRPLNERGITVSLDLLGESVSLAVETRTARDEVLQTLDGIASSRIEGNVSVKLTQLGLDIDPTLCAENMHVILSKARALNVFVRMDMESSAHTERTLRLFYDDLYPTFGNVTGVVIQSYLRRSQSDVEELIARGARVRLCKGAYAEPLEIAFQEREEVSASFTTLMQQLLEKGTSPAIATHDEALIDQTVAFATANDIDATRFEFQMLYGVRRDLQDSLKARGYNVRVYVPFGTHWYPYLMRRLAERPANMTFMAASLLKEAFGRG